MEYVCEMHIENIPEIKPHTGIKTATSITARTKLSITVSVVYRNLSAVQSSFSGVKSPEIYWETPQLKSH